MAEVCIGTMALQNLAFCLNYLKKDLEAIIKSALLILNNEIISILLCLKGAVVAVIVW
jgi:hypothetical protein